MGWQRGLHSRYVHFGSIPIVRIDEAPEYLAIGLPALLNDFMCPLSKCLELRLFCQVSKPNLASIAHKQCNIVHVTGAEASGYGKLDFFAESKIFPQGFKIIDGDLTAAPINLATATTLTNHNLCTFKTRSCSFTNLHSTSFTFDSRSCQNYLWTVLLSSF